jgi:hypothetical protein
MGYEVAQMCVVRLVALACVVAAALAGCGGAGGRAAVEAKLRDHLADRSLSVKSARRSGGLRPMGVRIGPRRRESARGGSGSGSSDLSRPQVAKGATAISPGPERRRYHRRFSATGRAREAQER